MRKTAATLVLMILAGLGATATDKTDVMAVVQKWSAVFNAGGFRASNSICADDAVVMDDFPPHTWQGHAACSRWYKDFEAYTAKATITNTKIVVGEARQVDVAAGYAYVVAPVTLTFSKAGKPVTDIGILTMALHKSDGGWQVSGFAWADP